MHVLFTEFVMRMIMVFRLDKAIFSLVIYIAYKRFFIFSLRY